MEKRALLAIALSIAVMVAWQMFFAPPLPEAPQLADPNAAPGSIAEAPHGSEPAITGSPMPGSAHDAPATSPSGELPKGEPGPRIEAAAAEEFRVKTVHHDVRLTNQGGRVLWWRLPKYTKAEDVPVELVPAIAEQAGVLPLQVEIPGDLELTRRIAAALHQHVIEATGVESDEGPGQRIVFTWSDGEGLSVRKSIWIPENGYVPRIGVEVTRYGKPVQASMVFAAGLSEDGGQVKDTTSRIWHVEGRPVYQGDAGAVRIAPQDLEASMSPGQAEWAGLESTYFAALALPSDDPSGSVPPQVIFEPRKVPAVEGTEPHPLVTASIPARGAMPQRVFVGPKDYQMLASMGHGLELVIDFSSYSLIYQITKYLFLMLVWINSWVGNYGWAIILLTCFVRILFFPITYKSMIAMRKTSKKMAKIQPKVRAIQERYKKMKRSMESQQKMNQEVMALYQKEGVNPMSSLGGCLPLLLQMPIFIAFYNLLAVTIEVRQAPFIGWIQDLSLRDPYYISPILMGGSWLLQQAMTSSSIPDPMQRRMMMFMPVIFTFMMMNMPSGLVIYWLTSNILGMGQQLIINRKADAMAGPTQQTSDKKARGGGKVKGAAEEDDDELEEDAPKTRRAEDGQTA